MVRDVPRAAWRPYLARADELLATAGHAFEAKYNNAAVHMSVSAAISALDSLAAGAAGFRSADDYGGALDLVGASLGRRDRMSLERHIGRLLALKRLEREPDLMTRRQASGALRSARRVRAIVGPVLGRMDARPPPPPPPPAAA